MTPPVIDTLQLNIIVNMPTGVETRITNLRSSLSKLYTLLQGIKGQDFSNISSSLIQLSNAITPLATSLSSLSIANKNLSGFSTRLKTLNSNLAAIDSDLFIKKFSQMTVAITPFVNKIKEAESALIALNGIVGKTNVEGGNVGIRSRRSRVGFGSFFSKIYTFYFAITLAKRLGQSLGNVVQKGIDYEETLNLWQVAMKGNVEQAKKFVSEISKAYGISDEVTMRYQATFKNMISALGQINQDVAYGLSETLTQMALDYSSLYNTTVESAMIKFQSALAGQVRPIRSESGYDITENTLYQLYQEIGGTKSIRQLSQTEKRLLRILAIYKQMQDTAKGDLAKTIQSSANQMRVMSEQGKQFVTWLGVAANQLIQNSGILIEINGYLYAAAALAKAYAFTIGYTEKDAKEDPFGDMSESADNAANSVENLKSKLLGFDKFQVLSSANTNNDGDNISEEITKAMADYGSILNNAVNPAYERGLEILESWGVILGENGSIVSGLDKIVEKVKGIAKSIGGLIAFIGLMTKPWLVLVGAIEYAYFTNEEFRESMNTVLTQLGGAGFQVFQELAEIFRSIAPTLVKIGEGFAGIIGWLDEMELLDEVIWLVVGALIAWKTITIAIATYKFASSVISGFKAVATFINTVAIKAYIKFNTFILNTLIPTLTTFATMIKTTVVNGLKYLQTSLKNTITWLKTTELGMLTLKIAAAGLAIMGFMVAANAAKNLFTSWDDMSGFERAIEIFKILASAAMIAAAAVAVFHTSWSVGIAAGVIAAGIAVAYGAIEAVNAKSKELEYHANGGLATKGSLFYAGEAGPELVTRTSGGGSTIMNMKQLEDAVARGMIRGMAATDGSEGKHITVNVGARNLFDIFVSEARSNGYELVKVR